MKYSERDETKIIFCGVTTKLNLYQDINIWVLQELIFCGASLKVT